MLKGKDISFRIGNACLLKQTSVEFETGMFHVIMGANGAGKSTLLKLLSGDIKPSSGTVSLEDKELSSYKKKTLATKRAVLSQHYHLAFPISAEEVVLMGRYPYFSTQPSANDISICKEAMALMDVTHLAQRDYTTLSGGEAQKVQMSRVLSQLWKKEEEREGNVLFLDEPVSHLDVKYQHQLLRIAKEFCRHNTTVVAVLHDINLALNFADTMLLMKNGEINYRLQNPSEINSLIIRDVFSMEAAIISHESCKKPVIIF